MLRVELCSTPRQFSPVRLPAVDFHQQLVVQVLHVVITQDIGLVDLRVVSWGSRSISILVLKAFLFPCCLNRLDCELQVFLCGHGPKLVGCSCRARNLVLGRHTCTGSTGSRRLSRLS